MAENIKKNICKVTVIMPVYNCEKYLHEAIDSILNQTFIDFEFIIINDGSKDRTNKILQSYQDQRIVVINNERNLGIVKSLNKGLKLAKGEYIARQDADDISLPERFEKQVEFLKTHKNIGLVGSAYLEINESGRPLKVVTVSLSNEEIQKNLLICNAFGHGTIMFRKEYCDRVGFYREELKHVEDYDLVLRFAEQYEVANIGEPLYKYRITLDSISVVKKSEQDKHAELAKELAWERKQYGRDRLQTSSKKEIEKILNDITLKSSKKSNLIKGYYGRGKYFYLLDDYSNALRFLMKPFPYNFFNKNMIVLILKAWIKIIIPERLWLILKKAKDGLRNIFLSNRSIII